MKLKNRMDISLLGIAENVATARVAAAAFAAQLDLTLDEIEEIKVAVSEAVSNAVIHAYGPESELNMVELHMVLYENLLEFTVQDTGKGIADISLARQPAYSTDPERMGLGFAFMQSFMDGVSVTSSPGKGTTVILTKKLGDDTAH